MASVFGTTIASADAVAIQPDGKVVAAGRAGTGLAVARYTTAGVLDATFGTGGAALVDLGAQTYAGGVVLQADGSIVVAGERFNNDMTNDVIVIRVHADGTLDAGFGTASGIGGYPLGRTERPGSEPVPIGVARAADGRVLIATSASTDGLDQDLLLLRFSTSGVVDAKSVVALGPGIDVGHGLAVQTDGKLVASGRTWTFAGGPDFFIARFTAPP